MNPKLECLRRLLDKTSCFNELSEWLIDIKILDKDSVKSKNRLDEKAKIILESLNEAEEKEKLQLLYYEWSILPVEYIKLTIITDKEKREFTYKL